MLCQLRRTLISGEAGCGVSGRFGPTKKRNPGAFSFFTQKLADTLGKEAYLPYIAANFHKFGIIPYEHHAHEMATLRHATVLPTFFLLHFLS